MMPSPKAIHMGLSFTLWKRVGSHAGQQMAFLLRDDYPIVCYPAMYRVYRLCGKVTLAGPGRAWTRWSRLLGIMQGTVTTCFQNLESWNFVKPQGRCNPPSAIRMAEVPHRRPQLGPAPTTTGKSQRSRGVGRMRWLAPQANHLASRLTTCHCRLPFDHAFPVHRLGEDKAARLLPVAILRDTMLTAHHRCRRLERLGHWCDSPPPLGNLDSREAPSGLF